VLQGALKLALARKRFDHIRSRWFEQALLMSILLYLLLSTQIEALLLSFNSQLTPDALARFRDWRDLRDQAAGGLNPIAWTRLLLARRFTSQIAARR
jgi:hypothetical protein